MRIGRNDEAGMRRYKFSPVAIEAVAEALVPNYADADQETAERALDAAVRLLSFARNMAALNQKERPS